ncbi:SURF1 family protein [Aestuariicella hydrocarbonica]|uniref:SURF1-like protein n=1 Tax=Pseudomaricurvus hydrocarbonicus TaxID=1470433 RepID=A0A9E5MPB9_9GAMM|nr:SURF1 family protein [Aestuariicella hydrocarbonica]NHO67956.1 SURF1 family protein [Aestuariicella hydrocarbonica]
MEAKPRSSTKFSVTLRINWKLLLAGLFLLPMLIRLGFWQLERGEEKRLLQADIQQQQALPALPTPDFSQLQSIDRLRYRFIETTGHFDPSRYWLVDNKVLQGKVGYEVIAPFVDIHGAVLLVNRGWIEAPPLREHLPAVTIPKGLLSVRGRLNLAEPNSMIREVEQQSDQWPIRIQQLNIPRAEQQLGREVFDWALQLQPDSPAALTVMWRDVNVSVAKHQGYALQWFAMSGALLIALLFANTNLSDIFSNNNKSGAVFHER